MLAGLGLIAFETAELVLIGFQPLEASFGAIGAVVLVLAARQHSSRTGASHADRTQRQSTGRTG